MAMCIALAMILSYVESLLPSPGVPGVKLGLANLVVIFALYKLGWGEAAGISLLRVFLVSLLFGHAASLMIGGVLHNVGQILTAWLLMGPNVVYYLPVLILSGTAAGVAIGAVSALLIRRVDLK